jgi:hypothetical protein
VTVIPKFILLLQIRPKDTIIGFFRMPLLCYGMNRKQACELPRRRSFCQPRVKFSKLAVSCYSHDELILDLSQKVRKVRYRGEP